ncbi:hypothetical protein BDV95DRAFT_611497 [Massariosphaeria phaeospora]|uniref:UBA domain-containing protein n=1 Tax=Massariosphaeria phaeospora TaxID=100035 RepID=A0A7C8I889_9PLEO|nr:hypothetical protein BDV95DRAFT_611497 [Massariosphaeria phaeospora]
MRVIQDSDDEFDADDLEAAPKLADACTIEQPAASPAHGTGSTESLKRNIEAAHRAQFPSQPMPSADREQSAPGSSVSLPGHRTKRRRTAAECSPTKSPATGSQKKVLKTYGRSRTVFGTPLSTHGQMKPTLEETELNSEKSWGLQGTMQDNYVQLEPMAMFPELSSTVPNATMTQQRLLEEIMDPGFLGFGEEGRATPYEPAKSSVPWSDFLKSSSGQVGAQSDPSNGTEQPFLSHGHHELQSLLEGTAAESGAAFTSSPHRSQKARSTDVAQRSRRSSSVLAQGSPLRKEIFRDDVDPKDIMAPPLVPTSETRNQPSASENGIYLQLSHISSDGNGPEVGPPYLEARQQSVIDVPAVPTPKHKSSSVRHSNDDLEAIDLPKEQYKPRPSRSRSLKLNTEENVDYSVRPEKAAKKGTKRRSKTVGAPKASSEVSTPQKVQQICDMGFTPSTTEIALKENNGDINSTVNWLVANGAAEDELAPPRSSRSRNKAGKSSLKPETSGLRDDLPEEDTSSAQGRDRKVSFSLSKDFQMALPDDSIHAMAENILKDQSTHVADSRSPKVQVVIPSKETKKSIDAQEQHSTATVPRETVDLTTPSKTAKRRKTTLDKPETIIESDQTLVPNLTQPKRRGRGRPRKEPTNVKSSENVSKEPNEGEGEETVSVVQQKQPGLSHSIQAPLSKEVGVEQGKATLSRAELPNSTPPSKTTPAPLESIRTPEKQLKSATTSHSPISKGTVKYRVGLSKRARIAPLLRTLKK